jgi:hypothetical protein
LLVHSPLGTVILHMGLTRFFKKNGKLKVRCAQSPSSEWWVLAHICTLYSELGPHVSTFLALLRTLPYR